MFEPRPEDFFLKDQTVKNASVILWPWNLDASDFAFHDTVDADRKCFTESPHRNFHLRFASQLEVATWIEKTVYAIKLHNALQNWGAMRRNRSFSKEASND
jgi:hypothetical protein